MRRHLLLSLAMILLFTVPAPATHAALCGDVDGDGTLTSQDAMGVLWMVRKLIYPTVSFPSWLDADGDGTPDGCGDAGATCGDGTVLSPDGTTCVVDLDSTLVQDLLDASFASGFDAGLGTACDDPSACPELPCGNGVLEPGEECDDGDDLDGNGCSADCTVEVGWGCPSDTSGGCTQCPGDGTCFGNGTCDEGAGGTGTCTCAAGYDATTGCETCEAGLVGPDCVEPNLSVQLNELRIDQPGSDEDEYVELKGDPGASLDGLWLVVLGDTSQVPDLGGTIEEVIDLSGMTIPDDGIFLLGEESMTLATPDVAMSVSFENSDNVTYLLVAGFTGAELDDLDTDDDGVLDVEPWDIELDRVALVEEENPPTNTEYHYGPPQVGPVDGLAVSHAFRCDDEWIAGTLDPTDPEASDTPGEPNDCPACGDGIPEGEEGCDDGNTVSGDGCDAECQPESVQLNEVRVDQPGSDTEEYVELWGPDGLSLDGVTLVILGDSSSLQGESGVIEGVVPLDGLVFGPTNLLLLAESNFSLATADYTTNLNLENSDNIALLLVEGFTGESGDNLDTDNDGTLDVLPWTAELARLAIIEQDNPPTSTEYHYGPPLVGPDGSSAPGHVYRCGASWFIGVLDPYDAGALDTPGFANPCD